ncbi:hypothetical protein [Roseomonas genomospecies 6]|uniref:Uncharacterized protein n=1 Tax=Roseomonas genomospecies 6 TaxID=214106 RepID=A0A9W7NFG8_9PROT|nr:hypothetical protein [Roseomonas genomospecies 6]KAA0677160.1 hypothetical protein DS843_24525 [Roseomonas genomospecies 6]
MQTKTLINKTGHPLTVTLTVRMGDHPTRSSGEVTIDLEAGDTQSPGLREVTYGDEDDVHLNAITAEAFADGATLCKRSVTVERGSGLDRAVYGKDAIEFLFDGDTILISCVDPEPPSFSFMPDNGDAA